MKFRLKPVEINWYHGPNTHRMPYKSTEQACEGSEDPERAELRRARPGMKSGTGPS